MKTDSLKLNYANYIKALLVDHYLKINDNVYLGNEVTFGKNKRLADLIILRDKLYGFEIKAHNDHLRNLRNQLNDYSKVFDYVYAVVTENHLNKAKSHINKNEGLLLIKSNEQIEVIKPASQIKKNTKTDILETIPVSYLKTKMNLESNLQAYVIRKKFKRKKIFELKNILYGYIEQKLIPTNQQFFKERGVITHFEEIQLLSKYSNLKLY